MYVLNTEKVFYDKSEDESIVINFITGYYYCFNAIGAVVFEYLVNGGDPQTAAGEISNGLNEFIGVLLDKEILLEDDSPYGGIRFECTGINNSEAPTVTEYAEVRNLILADPVDDVRVWE